MSRMGSEPTTPVFDVAKIGHALDRCRSDRHLIEMQSLKRL
jgi:hypothetical protein